MLRVRYLPSDLTEVKFKDRVTFTYFYEQVSIFAKLAFSFNNFYILF